MISTILSYWRRVFSASWLAFSGSLRGLNRSRLTVRLCRFCCCGVLGFSLSLSFVIPSTFGDQVVQTRLPRHSFGNFIDHISCHSLIFDVRVTVGKASSLLLADTG